MNTLLPSPTIALRAVALTLLTAWSLLDPQQLLATTPPPNIIVILATTWAIVAPAVSAQRR